ncbi:MAG: hypothetical protein ACR2O0_07945, partial [Rhizobiaceae bacterium]
VPVSNRELGIEASLSCIFVDETASIDILPKVFANLWSFAKLIENQMQLDVEEITASVSD